MKATDISRLEVILDDVVWTEDEKALVDEAVRFLRALTEAKRPTLETLFGLERERKPDVDIALSFTIPRPMSSKNTQKLTARGGTPRRYRPKEVDEMQNTIRARCLAAMQRQAPQAYAERRPLFRDEDVRIEMVHNVHQDTCDVLVRRIGPKPKGLAGRRCDVHNLPELVCDAIQRIAYKNDNQVCDLRVFRNLGAPANQE